VVGKIEANPRELWRRDRQQRAGLQHQGGRHERPQAIR